MGQRLSLAAENTIVLFLPSAVVGIGYAYYFLTGPVWLGLLVAAAVPAIACLIVELLILFWPALVARGNYTVWTCLILPLVHVAVMVAASTLATVSPTGITALPEEFGGVLLWLNPLTLLSAFVAESLLFAFVHLRRR